MDSLLVDFLNHGYLPFTGRRADIDRISTFLAPGPEAPGLRALLIVGEAGVGKSRLIEEIVPTIIREGGVVVRSKLYPETTASIVPSLIRALHHINLHRNLLTTELDETLPSVASALRRLGHLRPTVLIIEDIHLLSNEAFTELARLLEAIGDEPISMICTARPLGNATRGILTRFLIDDIELQGLNDEGINTIMQQLFATRSEEITREIQHATLGNPLALRSALRGLITSGALAHDMATGTWKLTVPQDMFRRTLQRSVELLSEGMAAHLSLSEKNAAELIASLGEVFSTRTAEELLETEEPILSSLIFKGILVASGSHGIPIQGNGDGSPVLAFTHTLLHRRLADQDNVNVNRLLHVINADLTLYSLVPFHVLDRHATEITAEPAMIASTILQIAEISHQIDITINWQAAPLLWEYSWRLFEVHRERLDSDARLALRLDLIKHRIGLLRRQETSEEYGRWTSEYLALTENPQSKAIATHRILGLIFRLIHRYRCEDIVDSETRREIDELTAQDPTLLFSQTYVFYLEQLARIAKGTINRPLLRSVEQHLKLVLSSENLTDEFRHIATRKLLPYLLLNFETREQLRLRLAWLDKMEQESEGDRKLDMLGLSAGFLIHVGEFDRALHVMDRTMKRVEERGAPENQFRYELDKWFVLGAFGMGLMDLEPEIRRIYAEGERTKYAVRHSIPLYVLELGYFLGHTEWGVALFEELRDHSIPVVPIIRAVAALHRQDREEMRRIPFTAPDDAEIARLITEAATATIEEETIRGVLRKEILTVDDLIPMRMALDLATHSIERKPLKLSERMEEEVSAALSRMMQQLEEWKFPPFMASLLTEYKSFFTKQDLTYWQNAIARVGDERRNYLVGKSDSDNSKIRLSILGSIEAQLPDGKRIPIRGSRLRALLGLMVADHMLDTPLDHREFCAIITGIDDDSDRARRSLNGVVYRLREMIRHDMVITDGDTPVLNLQLVTVDLLEAEEYLAKASAALQQNSLIRAHRAMLQALDILGGEVPFPTLYERFFEAIRDDFEHRVRDLILRITQGLLADNDPASAETLLSIGLRSMPEDEEIAEKLHRTLIQLGKRTEAERIRIRAAIGES